MAEQQHLKQGPHMKVGITSQNFRTITGHAGRTRRFIVYSADAAGDWKESSRIDLPKEMSMHEFRGDDHPIDELDILITAGCGNGFRNKMAKRGIEVITTSETDPQTAIDKWASGEVLPPAEEPDKH
jgi:predicted Fe-Mo cluster-binding NifX family protein